MKPSPIPTAGGEEEVGAARSAAPARASMIFYLSPDVHACRSNDLIVLLDVRRDRYSAAPASAFVWDASDRALRACVGAGCAWADKLVARGLVRTEASPAAEQVKARRVLLLQRMPAFVVALVWARAAVDKPLALRGALETLRGRRAELRYDIDKAKTEANVFAGWRPLWPRPYVCLHDTLALAFFLSARGVCCDVVFGVQGRPFAAHCWAEVGGHVLNDDEDYCSSFDVILRT